ncbi:hypothetical protein KFL_004370040 [Klebsormidium nitens]|uniref:F-box domain-containing protein n=1 Tax=Klebsormidium nitens TaxID=105231 RepID=A0A1Y1IC45_KLENI|nr:hypothetical protein KFL_004370040 [Klebsormidium nitens]|eukprot:GAQ88534.1 hypothetical protein KFL_004370040 [Klebsormidium nitens]
MAPSTATGSRGCFSGCLLDLPEAILLKILNHLPATAEQVFKYRGVCKQLRTLSKQIEKLQVSVAENIDLSSEGTLEAFFDALMRELPSVEKLHFEGKKGREIGLHDLEMLAGGWPQLEMLEVPNLAILTGPGGTLLQTLRALSHLKVGTFWTRYPFNLLLQVACPNLVYLEIGVLEVDTTGLLMEGTSLKTLVIEQVVLIDGEPLEILTLNMPELETLILQNFNGTLKVETPQMLKNLRLCPGVVLEAASRRDFKSIEDLSIGPISGYFEEPEDDEIIVWAPILHQVVHPFPRLKVLDLRWPRWCLIDGHSELYSGVKDYAGEQICISQCFKTLRRLEQLTMDVAVFEIFTATPGCWVHQHQMPRLETLCLALPHPLTGRCFKTFLWLVSNAPLLKRLELHLGEFVQRDMVVWLMAAPTKYPLLQIVTPQFPVEPNVLEFHKLFDSNRFRD